MQSQWLISKSTENFFRGWNAIGLLTQPQPNAGDANGAIYGPLSLNAKDQSRSSASNAYYRPIASERSNLHLIVGHVASRINFDRFTARSVDVRQRRHLILVESNVLSTSSSAAIRQQTAARTQYQMSEHAVRSYLRQAPPTAHRFCSFPA